MRFGNLFAVAVAAGLSTTAFAVIQPTTYEDFTTNSDGRWVGVGNRSNPGVNDYGWADTDNTGNAVIPASGLVSVNGELGGSIQRGNLSHYGFDTGAMDPTDVLHADGVYRHMGGSGNWFIGFYNSADHITTGGDPRNFIGIQLDDSVAALYHNARSDHNDRTHNGPANIAAGGTTVTWSIDYNGAGQTTFSIGSDVNIVLNSGAGYFTGGGGPATVFDRFGIFPGSTSDSSGLIALDDITFSSTNPVPEPASLGLLAIGSLVALRRRK
jgi:hypothetical protein